MTKKDTYTYEIGDAIYVNLTNKCTNRCTFCVRNGDDGVSGYNLWIKREPTAEEIIAEIEARKGFKKIVMCGFGEPTIKIDELITVAKYFKAKGYNIRINTNGHANAYHGRNVAKDMKGIIDEVSISLNAPDKKQYQEVCKSRYGEDAFDMMLDFARCCVAEGIKTTLSVVDVIGEESIEKCALIAKEVGAKLRVRTYIKPESNVDVHEYKKEDIARIAEIWNEVIEFGFFPADRKMSIEEAKEYFASQTKTCVALKDGKICGVYILHPNGEGHLKHTANASYAVARDERGKGIGRALVEHSLEEAKRCGFKAMQYNAVVNSNERAIKLYESLGFEKVGVVKNGYKWNDEKYEDMTVFHKWL